MKPKHDNPLEPLQEMGLTEEETDRILGNLRTIMQAEEADQPPIRSVKRRPSWWRLHSVAAGGIAVVVLCGVIWGTMRVSPTYLASTGGNVANTIASQGRVVSNGPTSNSIVQSPTLHTFAASRDWQPLKQPAYALGLTAVTPPAAPQGPSAFEESVWPKSGIAEIDVSKGTQSTAANWRQPIVFNAGSLNINGQTYTVPTQYAHQKLFVLPLTNGIVWAAASAPLTDWTKLKQALQGQTLIFYTPYQGQGGSLAAGAQTIAKLPHAWLGLDAPTVTSAWSGWLPGGDVIPAVVKNATTYHLQMGQHNQVKTSVRVQGKVRDWPTLFERGLTKSAYYSKPHYLAAVDSLTRTAGGFTLQVKLTDATKSGRNSGLVSANYYWSETTQKWTPLAQVHMVQDVSGSFVTGSDAAYWIQPSPVGDVSGNALDVTEMYFDPNTRTMQSIWLGNWYEGAGYVDGASLVTVLAGDMATSSSASPTQWTVYTPGTSGITAGGNSAARNLAFKTSVTFPNGHVLKPNESATWQGLNVSLQISSIPSPLPSPSYDIMLGNHSTVLSHQQISTSAGQATLVLNERTPPAASQSTKASYEYWVIVDRSQYAYAIKGTFTGDRNAAKAAMLELVNRWKVPS